MVDSSKYVALYDYEARSGSEISFKKGEIFVISKRASEWLYGRSAVEVRQGYVPANFFALATGVAKEKYCFGNISRKHCEIILSQQRVPAGTFIVRESESSPGTYSLSVRNGNTSRAACITHYRFYTTGARPLYHIKSNKKFSTLSELLDHYKKPGNGLDTHLTDVYSPFLKSKGPPLPPRTSSVSTSKAVSEDVPNISTRPETVAKNRDSSTVCQSCDDEIATVKFHPCGHTLFCEVCSIPMKKCMLCRSRIESKSEGMTKSRTVREVELLKQQLNQVIEERQCEICLERMKVMVFNPCGHGTCQICSARLQNCHMCRKTIISKIKTF